MKYLIIGLGNLGNEYDLTRHNIGFITLDSFAKKFNLKFDIKKNALYTSVKYKSRTLHLIKPSNYVNNSGKSVNYWMNKLKVNIENILVVMDDISLPFGTIELGLELIIILVPENSLNMYLANSRKTKIKL